jgi:hypothetical protein
MAKKRPKHSSVNLPGSLYQRNGRWWWKVQLSGEDKPKARPLKPVGSRYATTDYVVAVECAKQLLQQHLFEQETPFEGEIKIIPDLIRVYVNFADQYYIDSHGKPTREPESIKYVLEVLLERFPSMPNRDASDVGSVGHEDRS